MARALRFSVLPGRFAVHRLPAGAPMPEWARRSPFISVTRTADELSIVCAQDCVPTDVRAACGYVCMKLAGPFPLTESGIIVSFLAPLAERGIPVFPIATFDTDYILVQEARWNDALQALHAAGHLLV